MSDPTPKLHWQRVLHELQRGECANSADEWAHPDYAAAARACGGDAENVEKLRRLSEDLEALVSLHPGPGSFMYVARVPAEHIRTLQHRCWRSVLTDERQGRLLWLAVFNFGRALQSSHMDPGSRRTGRIFAAVAGARMRALGEKLDGISAPPDFERECESLLRKPYVPQFIRAVLAGHSAKTGERE